MAGEFRLLLRPKLHNNFFWQHEAFALIGNETRLSFRGCAR